MLNLVLSAAASFAILVAVYFLGALVVPIIFWKLPAFRDIRATQEKLTTEVIDIQFNDEAWKFLQYDRATSRLSVFVHSNTSEDWINTQIEELTNILMAMCALQAIGVMIALFGSEHGGTNDPEKGGFHLLIHAPVPEIIFLVVMIYLLHKMGKHWLRTKLTFRRDAW